MVHSPPRSRELSPDLVYKEKTISQAENDSMKDSEEVEDNTQGLMMREEVRINLSSASYGAAKRTNQKMMSKNKRLSQHNEGPGIFD